MTKRVLVVDFKSQLDSVWQYRFVDSFKQLVTENLNWFCGAGIGRLTLIKKSWLLFIKLRRFSVAFFGD